MRARSILPAAILPLAALLVGAGLAADASATSSSRFGHRSFGWDSPAGELREHERFPELRRRLAGRLLVSEERLHERRGRFEERIDERLEEGDGPSDHWPADLPALDRLERVFGRHGHDGDDEDDDEDDEGFGHTPVPEPSTLLLLGAGLLGLSRWSRPVRARR